MIYQVMALYDVKARAYRTPFFVPHVDVGLRAIRGAVNNAESELHHIAADMQIFHLGEFDDQRGVFDMRPAPFNHGCALVLKDITETARRANLEDKQS